MIDQQTPDDDKQGGVTAVARAIKILRVIGDSAGDLSLTDVSVQTGLPRSTVHRIVQTLREENFVTSSGRNGLSPGPDLVRIAAASPIQLVAVVRPFLMQISRAIGEGVSLATLEGDRVRFLDQAITDHGLRAFSLVGSTFPAHSTANGKALLAALPAQVVKELLPPRLEPQTERTVTSRAELLEELSGVRETGVAFDREENELGICAIGVTIRDGVGNLAAVTVAMPASRFAERSDAVISRLRPAVEQINAALSHAS